MRAKKRINGLKCDFHAYLGESELHIIVVSLQNIHKCRQLSHKTKAVFLISRVTRLM